MKAGRKHEARSVWAEMKEKRVERVEERLVSERSYMVWSLISFAGSNYCSNHTVYLYYKIVHVKHSLHLLVQGGYTP